MARKSVSRKARFKSALALSGMTAQDWCEKQEITYTHLYLVLRDDRQSKKLAATVDAFIASVEAKVLVA